MINNTYYSSNKNFKNNNILPTNLRYFYEGDITEVIEIPDNKNNIDTLTSVITYIDIINYKLQKYTKSKSYSGQCISDNKLVVELLISRQLKYACENIQTTSSIIGLEDLTKVITIAVPNKISNISIDDIVRRGE